MISSFGTRNTIFLFFDAKVWWELLFCWNAHLLSWLWWYLRSLNIWKLLEIFSYQNLAIGSIFVDALGKHPLCHRMCKVTKETSGANKIMRNAIDSTSITFWWTSSSSRQSVFSTTTITKKTEENGSQSRKSDYLVKIGRWTSELLLG